MGKRGLMESDRQRLQQALTQGRPDEVLRQLPRAEDAESGFLRGMALQQCGRLAEALAGIRAAIAMAPGEEKVLRNAEGCLLAQLQRPREALNAFEIALGLDKDDTEILYNLGRVHEDLARPQRAVAYYRRALERQPGQWPARLNLAAVLLQTGAASDALAEYSQLVDEHPALVDAWIDRARCLLALGRYREALADSEQALRLAPDTPRALLQQALALASEGRIEAAQPLLDRLRGWPEVVRELTGETGAGRDGLLDARRIYLYRAGQHQQVCDWSGRARYLQVFTDYALAAGPDPRAGDDRYLMFPALVSPIPIPARSSLTRAVSARIEAGAGGAVPRRPAPVRTGRIRLGYLSPNFREHPSTVQTRRLFGLHDRGRFEVYGFDLSGDRESRLRADLMADFDRFEELSAVDDEIAAARIEAAGIDVLIDLAGYNDDGRPGILARRPAAVQIGYLGYAGSMHAGFVDYRITDREAEPPDPRCQGPEGRLFLPHTHYIYNDRQPISDKPQSRHAQGLPAAGFVFCCFNNPVKIEPVVFAIWMRLLGEVPGSVLWLLARNEATERNLRREAMAAGIDPGRLVFCRPCPLEEHLARHRLADLFLDTLWYNAHTTASDALWAGLPLLSCRGETLASRIAASNLQAAGLPELVTDSLEDYHGKALELARRPALLAGIRERLRTDVRRSPLFDTGGRVRALERAYSLVLQARREGRAPADIAVPG